jgi:AraC-like DNA-binding protein
MKSHTHAVADLGRTDLFGGFAFLRGTQFTTQLQPHVHAAYVLGVVEDGEVSITVGDESWVAGPGAVLALPPYVVHTELATSPNGWSFTYLYPTESVVRTALRETTAANGRLLNFRSPVLDDDALAASIRTVHGLLVESRSAARSRNAIAELCRHLRERHAVRPQQRESRATTGVETARAHITHAPPHRVKLGDLANGAGLSSYYFIRAFHNAVGLPPYSYFAQVRVAQAHDLIIRGHPLSAVAYELGYTDQAHLTRHFRRASFTTPGHLAALARRGHRAHLVE